MTGPPADFDRLCRESDGISLHIPLTDAAQHLIGTEVFAKMTPEVLLNCL